VDDGVPGRLDGGDDDPRGLRGEACDGTVEAPDGWRIGALGNAVVVQVGHVIGAAIMDALTRTEEPPCC